MLEQVRQQVVKVHAEIAQIWRRDGFLDRLAALGAPMARMRAFTEAVCGERPPAVNHPLQRPFYLPPFPGLRAEPWHDPSRHLWAAPLLDARAPIRAELERLVARQHRFLRYLRMAGGASWDVHPMWFMGAPQPAFTASCPDTARIVAALPDFAGAHIWGDAAFSSFSPGAHLGTHCSADNLRVRCHLPLRVRARGAWLRVGNETREWEEDRLLAFDDAFEHEASNPTSETRVVLIIDFWHPDLTPMERRAILAAFGRAEIRALFAPFRAVVTEAMRATWTEAEVTDPMFQREGGGDAESVARGEAASPPPPEP